MSEKAVIDGWDELLRLVSSVRGGRLSARDALDKLGSASAGDPVHRAADELGKLLTFQLGVDIERTTPSGSIRRRGHYYRPTGLPREQQPWLASAWRAA